MLGRGRFGGEQGGKGREGGEGCHPLEQIDEADVEVAEVIYAFSVLGHADAGLKLARHLGGEPLGLVGGLDEVELHQLRVALLAHEDTLLVACGPCQRQTVRLCELPKTRC